MLLLLTNDAKQVLVRAIFLKLIAATKTIKLANCVSLQSNQQK
jgi:hypothetical protein